MAVGTSGEDILAARRAVEAKAFAAVVNRE
jgi:hypothetical protein